MSQQPQSWHDRLNARLEERTEQGAYRSRRIMHSAQAVEVSIEGKQCINFCSNDYLGLANHPQIKQAYIAAVEEYGVGSGASHLVCGHSQPHHQLEEQIAEFTGRERALVFSSGYMANLGVISALASRGDAVFEDKLNHASLIDGGLLSGARFQRYLHADISSLEKYLAKSDVAHKLIVTDGVFSMDGDIAPLEQLASIAMDHQALLMVDDAHGFGVLGNNGGGCAEHYKLDQNQLPVLMGTFGKAFGTAGAFVTGSEALVENLIQFARPYIYTTALPPAVAVATSESLKLVQSDQDRRKSLLGNIQYFREKAVEKNLPLTDSITAIQPIVMGGNDETVAISQALLDQGLLVSAIRPPTVPAGTARLRITLCASHRQDHIDRLVTALAAAWHD